MTSADIRDMLLDCPDNDEGVCDDCQASGPVWMDQSGQLCGWFCRACWNVQAMLVSEQSQRPLLTGLNCLPGQQDLFTTDGGLEP